MDHKFPNRLLLLLLIVFLTSSWSLTLAQSLVQKGKASRPTVTPPGQAQASTNIIADQDLGGSGENDPNCATTGTVFCHWAWNDVIGWIDFRPTLLPANPVVNVSDTEIIGYASSSVGFISLNCDTAIPGGPAPMPGCPGAAGSWKVTNNPTTGQLAGWAWSDQIGWISFSCDHTADGTPSPYNTSTCPTSNYGVSITISESGTHCASIPSLPPTTCGDFNGWAWNDVIGWISFNCVNPVPGFPSGTCGTIQYKVKTSWEPPPPSLPDGSLTSSIFDTQAVQGAAINTIMWRGDLPTNTAVKFQIASSNCDNGSLNPPPTCTITLPAVGWNFDDTGACNLTVDSCFVGPGGSSDKLNDFYAPPPPFNIISGNTGYSNPAPINQLHHNNKRYVRYRILFQACNSPTCTPPQSPKVDDIIINWSP